MPMIIHKDNLPDIDIDKSSFIYEKDYILIQDEYICDVLKCMNVPEIDVDDFYDICDFGCFKNHPEVLERYALTSPYNAHYYALKAIKGRFELGEPSIATNAEYSYYYACDILEDRFELGENIIATDAEYGYYYAKHVLEGRFELGESAIATDSYYSYLYARDVVEGRFELGEHTILNSEYTNAYIDKFL